jgi:hypothetical protein
LVRSSVINRTLLRPAAPLPDLSEVLLLADDRLVRRLELLRLERLDATSAP